MPERMQLREIPISSGDPDMLTEESCWIYKQAFARSTISKSNVVLKPPTTEIKIKHALDFMRNDNFEVPFIALYRKEYVLPELDINDLWKIYYYDSRWCQLLARKKYISELFHGIHNAVELKNVHTFEELNDLRKQLLLKKAQSKMSFDLKIEGMTDDLLDDKAVGIKYLQSYEKCFKLGILDFVNRLGLTSVKKAESLVYPKFPIEENVILAVKFVVSHNISYDPELRKRVKRQSTGAFIIS